MSIVPDPLACILPRTSFYVTLAQFSTLTGLLLYGCRFARFTGFARLVLSFRSLVQLYLSKLEWLVEQRAGAHSLACRGMPRMGKLRLHVLNMPLSAPHVIADATNWLLCASSCQMLHTISIDFPAVEPLELVPSAAARLICACGPVLRNLRLRNDSVKEGSDCARLLGALDLGTCTVLRQLNIRALSPDRVYIDTLVGLLKTVPTDVGTLEEPLTLESRQK